MFSARLPFLLEGEPDGTNVADPPETPAEPVTQPETEEAVTDGTLVTPLTEADQPTGEPEAPPEPDDFTPEERRALLERLKDSDEFKEIIPKSEEPKPQKSEHPLIARQDDRLYQAVVRDSNAFYEQADRIEKLANDPAAQITQGDLDQLAAGAQLAGWRGALAERRASLTTVQMLGSDVLGVKGGDFDPKNPLHVEWENVITEVEATMDNNFRQRGRLLKETNAGVRAQLATALETSDAEMMGTLFHKAMLLSVKHGRQEERAVVEKEFEKRARKLVTDTKSNGNVEANARARQVLAGTVVHQSATTPSKATSGVLTLEESKTLPIEELIRRTSAS